MSRLPVSLLIPVLLLLLSGCSPKISPLYRDYEIGEQNLSKADVHSRIQTALENAGWTVEDGATANVIATDRRRFRTWGIYSIEVNLEVAPIGDDHVRIFINPYRHYFTGSRRKIPYLRKGLAGSIMKELQPAFKEQGFVFAGTAQSRDQETISGG